MPILRIQTGDILELKKQHPCGCTRFRVLRTGSEVRVVCVGCGRDVTFDRVKLEKAVRRVDVPAPEEPSAQGTNKVDKENE